MMRSLLALLFVAGCARPPPPPPPPDIPVRVRPVARRALDRALRYAANIEPATRVDLAFKVGGYVQTIATTKETARGAARTRLIQEGDSVQAGTVLARLRASDYRVKLEQARAQLAQAKAATEHAALDLARAQQLQSSSSITPMAFEGASARADAGRATFAAARAQLDEARLAMADSSLRAPLSGIVLRRFVEVGTLVGPGSPGFVIADTTKMKAVFGVPDYMLEKITLGTDLEVSVDALGRQLLRGTVSRVAAVADMSSRVFDIELTLDNADGRLRAGMIAALGVPDGDRAKSRLWVPLDAIVRAPGEAGRFATMVIDGTAARSVARTRVVQVGDIDGNDVEVLDGLAETERVVVSGASLLHDGAAVAIVP